MKDSEISFNSITIIIKKSVIILVASINLELSFCGSIANKILLIYFIPLSLNKATLESTFVTNHPIGLFIRIPW